MHGDVVLIGRSDLAPPGNCTWIVPFSEKELCIRDGCSVVARELLPWKGGALAIDGDGRIDFWTSGGSAELPLAANVHGTVATGPLGLVSIGDGQVLVSRDGIDSMVSSIPAEMSADGSDRGGMTVAVGERSRAGPGGGIPVARHPAAVTARGS